MYVHKRTDIIWPRKLVFAVPTAISHFKSSLKVEILRFSRCSLYHRAKQKPRTREPLENFGHLSRTNVIPYNAITCNNVL